MKNSKTGCRQAALLACAAALLLAVAAPGFAQPSSKSVSAEEVWITLGADAFEALRGQPELPAFEQLEARGDVVLTRVRVRDLEKISIRLHEATGRCAGFLTHRTLERAQRALEAADRISTSGAPIDYTIDQQALVQSLEPSIQASNILATIDHLSTAYNNRFHQHPSGTAAAEWIRTAPTSPSSW